MGLFLSILVALQISRGPDCPDAQACRQAALEAAARQDNETFHDLAWRAVQKGRRNDPELMYLLARAQSLSGRPGDALVMLERLAQMGVATDAATNDDFRRVRTLPGWKAFEEARTRTSDPSAPATTGSAASAAPPAMHATNTSGTPAAASPPAPPETASISFSAAPFVPAGLAYDSVSRRFLVGDGRGRRLLVIDEPSRHVATLVSASSAGFGDITALEIDRHEGDLWVTSEDGASSALHKLQLVSGRLLYSVEPPADSGPVRLIDVAVTPRSTVLTLDAESGRIFALPPRARALHVAARLGVAGPSSLAPAGENVVYVAHAAGIARVDLATHASVDVRASHRIDLARLTRMRMHRGALIGIQKMDGAPDRLVRVRLNPAGTAATSFEVLVPAVAPSSEVTISMTGDDLYYLSAAPDPAVLRIKLR